MENKIDIAAILKDCPRGMELNCTMFDNVTLLHVSNMEDAIYPITVLRGDGNSMILTKYGQCANTNSAKCVIFPKDKTTWEGFKAPCQFNDGDIVADKKGNIAIYKQIHKFFNEPHIDFYCGVTNDCGFAHCNGLFVIKNNEYQNWGKIKYIEFATEEEKQKLFKTIKDNGYRWNAETKTLEKLIIPKFKVGDIVRSKNCPAAGNFVIIGVEEDNYSIGLKNYCIKFEDQDNYEVINKPKFKVGDRVKKPTYTNQYIIKGITATHYTLEEVKHKFKYTEPIINDKDWELVPNKFDVKTLKTFDQVLVRLSNSCIWMPKLFSYYVTDSKGKYYPFVTIDNIGYPQCIPYNGNEHLCRTTNNCDEFYRVWEK